MQLPPPKYQDIKHPMEPTLKSGTVGLTFQNPEPSQAHTGVCGTTREYGFRPKTALDILLQAVADIWAQWAFWPVWDNSEQICAAQYRRSEHSPLPTLLLLPHQPPRTAAGCPHPLLPFRRELITQKKDKGNERSPYLFKNFSIWLYFIFLI